MIAVRRLLTVEVKPERMLRLRGTNHFCELLTLHVTDCGALAASRQPSFAVGSACQRRERVGVRYSVPLDDRPVTRR